MRASLLWKLGIVAAIIGGISGCASNADPQKAQADAMRDPKRIAPREDFEKTEDPPFKAKTLYAAGRLAESQGNYSKAVDDYWEAVKIDPNHRESLFRLGVVYSQLQHYPEAIASWKLYVKATNGDASGYSNLGFCYELCGKRSDAEGAYKSGIEKDPKNVPCRVNYGLMLARDGRTAEATVQLQAVLSAAEVHYNLASVYERQGKKEQARAEYKKALALDPNMDDAKTRLATVN